MTCWKIKDGFVDEVAYADLPGMLKDDFRNGPLDGRLESYTLPLAAQIAHRIAPWATLYVVPKLHELFGRVYPTVEDCRYIALPGHLPPQYFTSVLFHELAHACEKYMTKRDWECLDVDLSRGQDWPDDDYEGHYSERWARLFAAFSVHLIEGGSGTIMRWTPQAFMWQVYNGEFARFHTPKRYKEGVL